MGYRSEVVVAIKKAEYIKHVVLGKMQVPFLEKTDREESHDIFYWRWADVKWYAAFPEIYQVNCLINTILAATEEGAAFIRIGEELGDLEMEGDCYELGLEIHREIRINGEP